MHVSSPHFAPPSPAPGSAGTAPESAPGSAPGGSPADGSAPESAAGVSGVCGVAAGFSHADKHNRTRRQRVVIPPKLPDLATPWPLPRYGSSPIISSGSSALRCPTPSNHS